MPLLKYFTLIIVLCLYTPSSIAMGLSDMLLKCAAIVNDDNRLQCFDAYIKINTDEPKTSNPSVSILEKTHHELEILIPSNESNTEKLISEFGQAHLYTKEEKEFEEVKFIIKSAERNLRGKWMLEFENGQIWHEKDGDKLAKFSKGDQIIIKRGIMNAFKLKKIGTKRQIRVKRFK